MSSQHVFRARVTISPYHPLLPPKSSRIIDLHEFVSWAHKYDQAIRSTLCWKEERSPRLSLSQGFVKMSLSIRQPFTGCCGHHHREKKKVCQPARGGRREERWLRHKHASMTRLQQELNDKKETAFKRESGHRCVRI